MTSIPNAIGWHRRRLVEDAVAAYVEWREQCGAVWVAYSRWAAALASDAAHFYTAYSAALDREERASERYARIMRRVGDAVVPDLESMAGLATGAGGR